MQKIVGLIASRLWPLYWRYRHMWDRDWSESYKSEEALKHPHRQLILEAISKYEPIESVLEIGCGAGANLYHLGKAYPEIMIYGYDISDEAVKKARELLSTTKPGQLFFHISSNIYEYGPVDIIFTDATAIYVSDKNIKSFIFRVKYIAKKVFILCEWHSDKGPFIKDGHWVHNYKELLPGCKMEKIPPEAWPESPNWQEYGHIITYETS